RNGREVDLGQRRDRKKGIARRAGKHHSQHDQRGRDRPLYEWGGDVHGGVFASLLPDADAVSLPTGFDLIRAPGWRRYCPLTTTCSPMCRPLSTTANSPVSVPTLPGA